MKEEGSRSASTLLGFHDRGDTISIGWDVLRQTSIVVFYARQTRSPNCIDWACKIHPCRSRLLGIAQRWRNRNFRGHHRNIGRTNLREQVFASALPASSRAPRL